jgi:hypothetical protein
MDFPPITSLPAWRSKLVILLHVRFPWQHDVGALSRNNGIVQHCCVSIVTQHYWTALASLADNNVNKQHCYARNNRQAVPWLRDGCLRTSTDMTTVFWNSLECRRVYLATDSFWLEDWVRIGKLREEHVSLYRGRWRHSIVGAKWQVNDGLYAEVLS